GVLTNLTNVNGTLFFVPPSPDFGNELWKSDGTAEGTVLVKDINPGRRSSDPSDLTNVNGTLYFSADDGVHGRQLWKSDGTENGTVLVLVINPGGNALGRERAALTDVNGTLFFVANDGVHGPQLWESDGTVNGTVLVRIINPNGSAFTGPSSPQLLNVDGTLFFGADDGVHGMELWRSDGTAEGTFLVKD